MRFKKNNPDSPCCVPCSALPNNCMCWPLDTDGVPLTGATEFAETENGPTWDSSVKKLSAGSAKFVYPQGYLEADDVDCFSPTKNTGGWSLSFWIKAATNIAPPTCPSTGSTSQSHADWWPGVITKGYWNQRDDHPDYGTTPCPCPCPSEGTTYGEWFVFMHKPAGEYCQLSAWANVVNAPAGKDWRAAVCGVRDLDTYGGHPAEWNFVYWYIRGNHSWFHMRGETESSWFQRYENLNTHGGIVGNETYPPKIGTHIASSTAGVTTEQRLGADTIGGVYNIDNVLVDNSPATFGSTDLPITSPATIPNEATALYNSGSGKACPDFGR